MVRNLIKKITLDAPRMCNYVILYVYTGAMIVINVAELFVHAEFSLATAFTCSLNTVQILLTIISCRRWCGHLLKNCVFK